MEEPASGPEASTYLSTSNSRPPRQNKAQQDGVDPSVLERNPDEQLWELPKGDSGPEGHPRYEDFKTRFSCGGKTRPQVRIPGLKGPGARGGELR